MGGALNCEDPAGDGWLPAWAGWRDGLLQVEWCHFGAEPLREPFFMDSVTRAMRRPVNQLLRHRTPIQALGQRRAGRPGLPARGFVFHTSRCGSTLVAQMLAAMRGSVVLSEAPPVDAVLSAARDGAGRSAAVPDPERAEWLQWMLAALSQPRVPGDRHLFVKFDAWHTVHLPLIRRAFPEVPWVFLYRDPREVLASQLRQAGAFLVPGALERVGAPGTAEALPGHTVGERIAGLLHATCDAARAALPAGRGLLVNYAELPEAFTGVIAAHFGLDFDGDDLAAVAECARHDAKSPGLPYERRSDPPPAADPQALEVLETRALPAYRELERMRIAARG
jgi:gluconate kinase